MSGDVFAGFGSFETSQTGTEDSIPESAWLVRPCEIYKEEYSDCKSIKARFHQYFIFGETIDCSQWKKDFENCMDWRKNRNGSSLKKVIDSEVTRIGNRQDAMLSNDVWELRDSPPKDWNSPLPDYLVKKQEFSYLSIKQKEEEAAKLKTKDDSKFCVIS